MNGGLDIHERGLCLSCRGDIVVKVEEANDE